MTLTDKEITEDLKLPVILFRQWEELMNGILTVAKRGDKKAKQVPNDNVIQCSGYKIQVNFVNSLFLEIAIEKGKTDIMRLRYNGHLRNTMVAIFTIIDLKY